MTGRNTNQYTIADVHCATWLERLHDGSLVAVHACWLGSAFARKLNKPLQQACLRVPLRAPFVALGGVPAAPLRVSVAVRAVQQGVGQVASADLILGSWAPYRLARKNEFRSHRP